MIAVHSKEAVRIPHDALDLQGESKPSAWDRLDSWKEIAAYLRRSIRCVQRWERTEGLPVLRHQHAKGMVGGREDRWDSGTGGADRLN